MGTTTFEITGKKSVVDVEDFCQLTDELTFIGRFANQESIVIGAIVQYNGKFYATDEVSSREVAENMLKTSVSLSEICYIPEEYKLLSDCSIFIEIWNSNNRYPYLFEDSGDIPKDTHLLCTYAFYADQLEEAKKVVNSNKHVEIFINNIPTSRKHFLES